MLPSAAVTDEPTTPAEPPAPEPTPAPPPAAEKDHVTLGTRGIVRLAAGFYGIVLLFAIGYAFFDRIARDDAGDDPFLGLALPSLGLALAGIGMGLVIVGVTHVGMRALPSVRRSSRTLAGILGPLTWKQALALAVFSGVGEEVLFRGALWPHLDLLGTTFLFGLVHIIPRKDLWGYPLFALGAGLLLGLLRESSGSVIPPILAHVTVNALNLAWLGAKHASLTAQDGDA